MKTSLISRLRMPFATRMPSEKRARARAAFGARAPAQLTLVALGALIGACSGNSAAPVDPQIAAAIAADTDADRRPNVVLVVSDDQRWDLMSSQDHAYLHTPNLDATGEAGALMENAFVPIALCSPSRAALLTGRDPIKASAPRIVWKNNSFLQTQRTLAQEMQAAGYRTAYVGKWHLGEGSKPKPGFDHWESFDWLGDFFDPQIHINGEARHFSGYVDDVLSERAADLINASDQYEKPLFMVLALKAPHLHFEHPERHEQKFEDVDIPQPDTYYEDFSQSGKLQSIKDWLGMDNFHCGLNCFDYSWDTYIKSHYRAVLAIDDAIGRIRRAIDASLRADNTLLIYTSDNGYSLGDHGLTEKHFVYEEPIRVPLLLDPPGTAPLQQRHSELVSTVDIAPTVLDYASAPIPAYMSGRSLKPLMDASGEQALWREQLFFMYEKAQAAVRTDRYKLIKSLEVDGHFELYDLDQDPRETRSVYADPEYQQVRADMHRRLQSIVNENGWSPRKSYPLRTVLVSNLMPTAIAHEVAHVVSTMSGDPQAHVEVAGHPVSWETLSVGGGRFADRFMLKENPLSEAGLSRLVMFPVDLQTSWDPFVEVRIRRRTAAHLYLDGQVSFTTVGERLPLDAANPPLQPGENFILIRFDDAAAMDVKLELEAPADTLYLPLEAQRNLGTSPGRFHALDSWQPHFDVTLALSEGRLVMAPAGADPQIITENIHLDMAADGPVDIRIMTDIAGDRSDPVELSLYWRAEHDSFAATRRHRFSVDAGLQETVLTLDAGVVDALRLDVDSADVTVAIDSIDIVNQAGDVLRQWAFDVASI